MTDIKLFSINQATQELVSSQVLLEKELQNLIEKNMTIFFGVTFLQSEYQITNGRMDSLGIDENNCPVIFEYKRSINENVINQGLYYLDWLLDHKADFKLLVLEKLGNKKADAIDWGIPCVICIAKDFTKFDEHAVNQMQRNIKLVKYKKYESDLILFEFLNTPQVKAIQTDDNILINNKKGPDKTFIQKLTDASDEMKTLYYSVRDYILSLGDDIAENQVKLYVAFKKVKNVICVELNQHSILLHVRLDPTQISLEQGFLEDQSTKGHWGTGNLRIILKNKQDFERCKPLLDRAYNEN